MLHQVGVSFDLAYVTYKFVEKATSRKVEERGGMYTGCFRRNSILINILAGGIMDYSE